MNSVRHPALTNTDLDSSITSGNNSSNSLSFSDNNFETSEQNHSALQESSQSFSLAPAYIPESLRTQRPRCHCAIIVSLFILATCCIIAGFVILYSRL